MIYPSIRIEGNIISQEILSKLEEGDYPGQLAKDFGFEPRTKVKDEIAFAWATAKDYWRIFQRKTERLPETATATSETRGDWMKPLLELLGYQIETSRAEIIDEKSYAISHRAPSIEGFPIHIMGFRDDLDKRRAEGGPRMSPHGLLQEYLNVVEHLYGLVSNGRYLRLLRDSGRLVKLSFAEFDLQRMMEDDLYADFAIMYRLLHRTRMPQKKDIGDESLIERYHQDSLDAGSRIRERLSAAVEYSIIQFANGFLQHPANETLRKLVEEQKLKPEEYYQQLLRLIYRFLFLMVTEERDLIFTDGDSAQRDIYYNYYSIQRLRKLSEKRRYEENRFEDLWECLKTSFRFFETKAYGEKIGILPLDGDLFGADALGEIANCRIKNDVLLECIRNLTIFENEQHQLIRVNYGSLDVEEFGSVYEGLLEYDPSLTKLNENWSFQFIKGDKRSSSGSHYTPEELVQPLIKHSLDYVIEEKLKPFVIPAKAGIQSEEIQRIREAKRAALLSIKVCDVACGSGHILLSAARRIATVLAQVMTDEEQPSPKSFREAIREVIRHCIYGVDKNPLAVELCKVALWLEAHNPGMPLTFLDHRIRCGDSIVGLARREEIEKGISTEAFKTLPGDDKDIASMFRKTNKAEVEARLAKQEKLNYETEFATELKTLVSKANELQEQKDDTVEDFHKKREFFSSMQGAEYWRLKNIADLQVAQFFTPKTPEKKDSLATDTNYFDVVHNKRPSLGNFIYNATALSIEKRFFHWFLEFPEVFEQGGFNCILGNPPYLGGQSLSGTFGQYFCNWVREEYSPAGSSDLVVYFLRRIFSLIEKKSFAAIITTNSIKDGDVRKDGLEVILSEGGSINFAVRTLRWPGLAKVLVSLIGLHKGKWTGNYYLDSKQVEIINPFLDDTLDIGKPFTLQCNLNKVYQGSIFLGNGFLIDPSNAKRMIEKEIDNAKVLFPVINGDEINNEPFQEPSRFIINFFDWSQEKASCYQEPFQIVEEKVKPERLINKDKTARQKWWQHLRPRMEMYSKIHSLEHCFVAAATTKYLNLSSQQTDRVFLNTLYVFCTDSYSEFTILQSTIHECWARKYSGALKQDLRYSPTDCFETFPFPMGSVDNATLYALGEQYDKFRIELMHMAIIGLTKTYNLFHNPKLTPAIIAKESKQSLEISEQAYQDILKLRQLHKEMDEAVLAAYGWSDLDLEHGFHDVEYLPENDRIRYTISEKARKEVLRRLLKLNHEIHEEEVKQGLFKEKKPAKGKKAVKDTKTENMFS